MFLSGLISIVLTIVFSIFIYKRFLKTNKWITPR
jgi:hypothetical protein